MALFHNLKKKMQQFTMNEIETTFKHLHKIPFVKQLVKKNIQLQTRQSITEDENRRLKDRVSDLKKVVKIISQNSASTTATSKRQKLSHYDQNIEIKKDKEVLPIVVVDWTEPNIHSVDEIMVVDKDVVSSPERDELVIPRNQTGYQENGEDMSPDALEVDDDIVVEEEEEEEEVVVVEDEAVVEEEAVAEEEAEEDETSEEEEAEDLVIDNVVYWVTKSGVIYTTESVEVGKMVDGQPVLSIA